MKRILIAAAILLVGGGAYAADFGDLGGVKAAGVKVLAAEGLAVPAPAAAGKASAIQFVASIKMKVDNEKGELTIGFPKDVFVDPDPQDKAHLFVKITRGLPAPAVSWATVLCSGGRYLGYRGSNLNFPEKSGSFSISETLALGSYPQKLIVRTHPWISSDPESLDELCSPAFLEKMTDFYAETLPPKLGDFGFGFNARQNTLKVKWWPRPSAR